MTNKLTDIDEGVIRRVDWQSLIPLTLFFRAFSATFKFTYIALGAFLIALLAISLGFRSSSIRSCFNGCEPVAVSPNATFCAGEGSIVSFLAPIQYSFHVDVTSDSFLARLSRGAVCASGGGDCFTGCCFPLTTLVAAALFALFALALSRSTIVRLLTTSRSSIAASFAFAFRRFPSLILPVLAPCALLACLIALGMVGHIGALQFAAPIVVLLGFVTLFLCVITSLSAPLAVSAIAAEDCDGFDATSRGISYLTQRPLFWILYMVAACALAFVGLAIFEALAQLALAFFDEVYYGVENCWIEFWRLVVIATPDSYLIVALIVYTNAVYALLRRSVDGVPYDTCALNLRSGKSKRLRKILQDGKGAPTFDSANARREETQLDSKADSAPQDE